MMKPYFIKRFSAYLVDLFIVSLLAIIVTAPFPENSNLQKLEEESNRITDAYIEGSIDVDTFLSQSKEVGYDLSYAKVFYTIVEVLILILYFTVFQFYNKGQTLGKRLFRIQVVRIDDEPLTMNDMLCRSFLINTIFCLLVVLVATLFCGKEVFFYTSNIVEVSQGLFLIICGFMASFQKEGRGLHDMISYTKVINVEGKEMVVCEN